MLQPTGFQIDVVEEVATGLKQGENLPGWPAEESTHSIVKSQEERDFPGGAVDKTPHSQCRGPGFNPWSGN